MLPRASILWTTAAAYHDFLRRLGVEQIIDYEAQRFEDIVAEVDDFRPHRREVQERSWQLLKKGGVLVSTLNEPSKKKARTAGARRMRYTATESGADLAAIVELIDAGKVNPIVTGRYQLQEVAAAQEFLKHKHPAGKAVLSIN